MKNVLIIFAMLFLQVGVTAQENVPESVQKSLKAKYSSAEYIDWIVSDNYIATFWLGDFYLEAIFTKTGEWLETSTVLDESNLSDALTEEITKAVGEYYITYVIKVDKNDGSSVYVIDLSTDEDNFQVTASMEGKVLKKEVIEYAEVEAEEEGDGF
jgi:hypothetical protein